MSNENNQGGNNPKPVKTYDEPFGGQHIIPKQTNTNTKTKPQPKK